MVQVSVAICLGATRIVGATGENVVITPPPERRGRDADSTYHDRRKATRKALIKMATPQNGGSGLHGPLTATGAHFVPVP